MQSSCYLNTANHVKQGNKVELRTTVVMLNVLYLLCFNINKTGLCK